MTAAQENLSDETGLDAALSAVEAARALGQSVAAACRAVGISPSTYYRRKRKLPLASLACSPADRAGDAETLEPAIGPRTSWPFSAATPRAPFFWDHAFSEELSDSFVRRTFGSGESTRKELGALSAIATAPAPASPWRRRVAAAKRHLSADHPVFALVILASLALVTGLAVSSAADPAAWLRPTDFIAMGPPPR